MDDSVTLFLLLSELQDLRVYDHRAKADNRGGGVHVLELGLICLPLCFCSFLFIFNFFFFAVPPEAPKDVRVVNGQDKFEVQWQSKDCSYSYPYHIIGYTVQICETSNCAGR